MIPPDLLRRTSGHGYAAGCECDLEGGDPECKVQPPYESVGEYVLRLIAEVIALRATEDAE